MLERVQRGALIEVVSRHASDEAHYLKSGGPRRDYPDEGLLAETAETREHLWRNCAAAIEELGASSGEIEELEALAKEWAALLKGAVAR